LASFESNGYRIITIVNIHIKVSIAAQMYLGVLQQFLALAGLEYNPVQGSIDLA